MSVEVPFRYAMHIDLLYHTLAHMQVHNASDLFDPLYMQKVQRMRPAGSPDLRKSLISMEAY